MTTAQNEMISNVDEMAAKFNDKYEAIEDEISKIRSSVGSAKNGLTSQIRQINVSFNFKLYYTIFHFSLNVHCFYFMKN